MSDRQFFRAYRRSQDLHKQIHRLTKAFESDCTDEQIKRELEQAARLLQEVQNLLS